ncbi:MAG: DUF4139 domain-containing protein [Candidatus Eisenbacteria bacterium]|uniref:DUF4139 domain-containing protein n=1 Tax=Eiseniibacteriota bacterium TaxID=2212470 RepID=A0A849STU0_UNCEI|nr:DUF4139 domain-containing protein [Candidatus Eisenbacteria bacterium]
MLRSMMTTLLIAGLAAADALAAGPAVTVYTSDLALIRERRTFDVRAARDTLAVPDIPERLDFASVRLGLGGRAKLARLAYRYDLGSGDALLEHARGRRVTVSAREGRIVEGVLLAADGAWLVVRRDDGTLATLARHAVDEVRLAQGGAAISTRPTLEAVIEGAQKGRLEADLVYMTGGLSWNAEHVLERTGELSGRWSAIVTVVNESGRDYEDATLKLVAGDPRRTGPSPMPKSAMYRTEMSVSLQVADGALVEQTFSEYHLYALPRPATLRNRETQSLVMLEPREVKFAPKYLLRGGANAVEAQLDFVNAKDSGLGVPLPGGRVRIFDTDADGAGQFAGESNTRHVAEGEKFSVTLGNAFDLAAERKVLAERRISDREREFEVQIELRNRKSTAVTITVEESVGGDSEILKSTHPAKRKDANTLEWALPVASKGSVTLRFTMRTRY